MVKSVYNLIYISTASIHFTQEKLTELLIQSRNYNAEHEITGLLLYADGKFMQLLEGPKNIIDDLMLRILLDSRHHDVDILEQGDVAQRQFLNWSMAFLDFASPQVRKLKGYSTFLDFPVQPLHLVRDTSRSMHLLHSFRAIMSASNDSILKLAETIQAPGKLNKKSRYRPD